MEPEEEQRKPDVLEFYLDTKNEWRWRRLAPNGQNLANSGEGYKNRLDCYEIAMRVNGGTTYTTRTIE